MNRIKNVWHLREREGEREKEILREIRRWREGERERETERKGEGYIYIESEIVSWTEGRETEGGIGREKY